MKYRYLGGSGLLVARISLGTMTFGTQDWGCDEAEAHEILKAYLDAGGNFIDTADVYSAWVPGHSGGESETIIGRWMADRGNRDWMVIATKVGMLAGLSGLSAKTIRAAEILGKDVPMHKYAVQITVADVRDGACSSSTLKEANSWGKVDSSCEQMVYAEATSALPLLASYAYHKGTWKGRKKWDLSKLFGEKPKAGAKKVKK